MFDRPFSIFLALISFLFMAELAKANPAIQRALDATFVVRSDDRDRAFQGSGFVWEDHWALSNAHVVGAAQSVLLETRSGEQLTAKVFARDARRDIALLYLPRPLTGLAPSQRHAGIGSPVISLGAPFGLGFTATRGIISADPRQIDPSVPLRLVQHDAALNPGNSGGPLVDQDGHLLGMNSQIADGARHYVGISYAISLGDLQRLVPKLMDGLITPIVDLGIDVRAVDHTIAQALGVGETGVLIDDIRNRMDSDIGIRAGDIIRSVNGQAITTPGDLAFILEASGNTASFEIWRLGETQEIDVVLPPHADPGPAQPTQERHFTLQDLAVSWDNKFRITALPSHGAAFRAGLSIDDVVIAINGLPVTSAQMSKKYSRPLVIRIWREDRITHLILDPWSSRLPLRPASRGNVLDLSVIRF